ncbi:MAG: nucleotide-binding protein [Candidatus Aenigmarchaeota archaeon]|nr:nucleotide-binding protein [Candidatus Aenigmarchaeota archaeon]
MKIVLDTNFLLLPANLKVDIFAEIEKIMDEKYELVTIHPVSRELRGLARGKGKDAVAAKVGLQLLEKKKVKVLDIEEWDADKAILKMAEKENIIVCTLDMELRKKILEMGRKTIYLRAKKHLILG